MTATQTRAQLAAERLAPSRYVLHGREVEAVQLTEDSADEVFEWAPGKWRWESGRVVGMTVWADESGGPKTVAYFGDWVTRDIALGGFRAVGPTGWEQATAAPAGTDPGGSQ